MGVPRLRQPGRALCCKSAPTEAVVCGLSAAIPHARSEVCRIPRRLFRMAKGNGNMFNVERGVILAKIDLET